MYIYNNYYSHSTFWIVIIVVIVVVIVLLPHTYINVYNVTNSVLGFITLLLCARLMMPGGMTVGDVSD